LRYARAKGSKFNMRLSAGLSGIRKRQATKSSQIVGWRATADEDGHYCFAVTL
jgi:hypothetical protein